MKKVGFMLVLLLCAAMLCACGDESGAGGSVSVQNESSAAPEETSGQEAAFPEVSIEPVEELSHDNEDEEQSEVEEYVPLSIDYAEGFVNGPADESAMSPEGNDFTEEDMLDYLVNFVFTANEDITDFKFLRISFVEVNKEHSYFAISEELYVLEAISSGESITIGSGFEGDLPTRGFSYVDSQGQTRCFAFTMNLLDGSLTVFEFTPQ